MSKKQGAQALKQAVTLVQAGRLDEAHAVLTNASKRLRRDPEFWFLLGSVNGQLGRMQEVVVCCRRVLSLVPDHPGALSNLGNAHAALGDHEQALAHYRKALRITPNEPALHNNLGKTLFSLGRRSEAEEHLRRALAARPANVEARHNLADALQDKGKLEEAIENYREVLRRKPNLQQAHRQLANSLRQTGQLQESRESYLRALALEPDDADALIGLGALYNELGAQEYAAECLEAALAVDTGSVEALCVLGRTRIAQGQYSLAIESYSRAVALEPDNGEALGGIADAYEHLGDVDSAYKLVRQALDDGREGTLLALVLARVCRRFECCDEAVALMDKVLDDPELAQGPRRTVHFAAGKLHDSLGRYDTAFAHIQKANDLCPYRFDRDAHGRRIDELIETFSPRAAPFLPSSTLDSETPVFIVGMPRSGTSLVEQILASHPSVHGAGERNALNRLTTDLPGSLGTDTPYPRCLQHMSRERLDAVASAYLDRLRGLAPDATRITDKMPANFLHLGFIAMMFPRSRIIHCARDPMDTCLSIYFQHFSGSHPYATDLGHLAFYYRQYRRLMTHWETLPQIRMMTVCYEDLVANQERVSRELVDFCGLEWNPRCLQFHKTERSVATASYGQVRNPIYTGSMQRWRHYEGHLQPLMQELGNLSESN